MGKEQYIREMWQYFWQERLRVIMFREEKERQAGIQGQWQQESPEREYLEQMKCCNDTDCTQRMMRHGFFALKSGEWEDNKNTFRNEVKVAEWAFDRIKEALEKVAKDEARKLSTVQEIMIISTDYLRRIIAPAGEQGAVTMSYLCPNCNSFPLEDNLWGEKSIRNGGARSFEKNTTGSNQTGESVNQAKGARAFVVVGEPTRRWRWPHTL